MSNFMNQIAFKRGWNKVFARARIRWTLTVLSELEDYLGKLQIKISLGFLLDSMLQSKQNFFFFIQKNFPACMVSKPTNFPFSNLNFDNIFQPQPSKPRGSKSHDFSGEE